MWSELAAGGIGFESFASDKSFETGKYCEGNATIRGVATHFLSPGQDFRLTLITLVWMTEEEPVYFGALGLCADAEKKF